MKTRNKISIFIGMVSIPAVLLAATLLQTETGFIYPANMKHADSNFFGFRDKNPNFENKCHLANDYNLALGSPVYATDKGVVQSAKGNINGYNSPGGDAGAIVIKHQTSAGEDFYAVYGHINNLAVAVGDTVTAGQKIAEVGPYSFSGPHLHFGINTIGPNLLGYTPTTACTDNLGFVDPEEYMASHHTVKGSCKAVNDSITTTKNSIITSSNVLANDTDADGDTLSISTVDANSANGEAIRDNSDGTFTYTPALDFSGTDSFKYTMSDSNGCTSQGIVSITVTDPNSGGSGGNDNGGGSGGSGDSDNGGSDNKDSDSSSGGGNISIIALVSLLLIQLIRRRRKYTV